MKPSLSAKLAILTLTLLAASAALAVQGPPQFSADTSTTSANGNLNMTGKIYVSMPRMRVDMSNAGGETKKAGPMGGKMIMIVDGPAKMMYMLMTEQHMYMEFSTDRDSPMTQRMPKFSDMLRGGDPCSGREGATCKKLGVESIDGRPCDKWELTEKSGKIQTYWMDQRIHFPIKVISGEITTLYTNIKEGPQDPALFKVPSDYTKMDMGAMGGRPPR
ncbi:MAG: DUF4412 domain-containing protein [Acidobacteriia bacterium]|nr:DUF4412 domain-containing protein [Terriglobia bacterium]